MWFWESEHQDVHPAVTAFARTLWTGSYCESGKTQVLDGVPRESESVSEFVVRLKKLASTCSFGGSLSEALRDRLVSGLHPKMSRTQRHLLSITELTYAAAHDKCITDEMAGKANIEHMGDSRRFNMTVLDIAWSRTAKGQTSAIMWKYSAPVWIV